jgi:hypothetical protein
MRHFFDGSEESWVSVQGNLCKENRAPSLAHGEGHMEGEMKITELTSISEQAPRLR